MANKIIDDDVFVEENFEKLVKKYPHKRIVISQGEIFTGDDAVAQARRKYPAYIPLSLPIPGPEEFMHLL